MESAAGLSLVQPIREEIRIMAATPQQDGSPVWQLLDPVRNRFFRIGWLEFELLVRWSLRHPAEIAAAVQAETTLDASVEDVQTLSYFLQQHELIQLPVGQAAHYLTQRSVWQKGVWWKQWLHHYLFIRLPLVRPGELLQQLEARTRWLYQPFFWWMTFIVGLIAMMLVLRQLDQLWSHLSSHMNIAGVLGYGVALLFAKSLHELGHAVTATRYGVRVAHMGVALVVMAPMLYTDTGESWKLLNHHQRLKIAMAGVATELVLAVWSTLLWALWPDGSVRSALFFLATTSWVMSVAINASPFMRFDGYFILADALNMPNLHERASALARCRLRHFLFGGSAADPEFFLPAKANLLVTFSVVTFIYRMIVFFGIALAVYHYFFKVLGIFLFLVEISWFIVMPVWRELREWSMLMKRVSMMRKSICLAGLMLFGALFFIPWSHGIEVSGWIFPENQRVLYSPQAARLVRLAVHSGQSVQAGDTLAELEAPELNDGAEQARILGAAYQRQAAVLPVISERNEALSARAMQQSREMMQQADAHHSMAERLRLVAPFSGVFYDVPEDIQRGAWVTTQHALGRLVEPTRWRAEVFVPEGMLARVRVGQTVKIYPTTAPLMSFRGEIKAIDPVRVGALPHPMLDQRNGGSLATQRIQNRDTVTDAFYRVQVMLSDEYMMRQEAMCEARIEALPQSLWQRLVPPLLAVLVRESGF